MRLRSSARWSRRYGRFDLAEDATQEALTAAALQWPREGVPENPRVGSSRSRRAGSPTCCALSRHVVAEKARSLEWSTGRSSPESTRPSSGDSDDTLVSTVPVLPPVAVGRLADRPDAAGGRGAQHGRDRPRPAHLRADGDPSDHPSEAVDQGQWCPFRSAGARRTRRERLGAVLKVLYLIFNEGYATTTGTEPWSDRPGRRSDAPHSVAPRGAARRHEVVRAPRADAPRSRPAPGPHSA